MNTLAGVVDTQILLGVAIALAFAVIVSVFTIFQKSTSICLLSFIAAMVYYRQAFLGFLIVSGLAFGVLCWLNRERGGRARWRKACLILVALVVVFTCGRIQHWDHWTVSIEGAGLALFSLDMWFLLRLTTLFWEVGSGAVRAPTLRQYLTWTCLPLTLVGPVLRYSQMPPAPTIHPQAWKSTALWKEFAAGCAKLMAGWGLPAGQYLFYTRWVHAHWANGLTGVLITGPLGFYLTFAGYYQIMESLGRPLSFKLPMSYNFPIGRENISAFWMNWNMTATAVFRDYLFYNRWGRRTYNVYFNTMLVFASVGLWHAANAYWVLWGVLHGILFCIFLAWRKHANDFGQIPFRGTHASRIGSRMLTYVCVCMCWYLPSKILQKVSWT